MTIIRSEHAISRLVRVDGATKAPSGYLGQRAHVGEPLEWGIVCERGSGTERLTPAARCALARWGAPRKSLIRPSRSRYESLSRATYVAAGSQIALLRLSPQRGFIAQWTNLLSRGTWAAGD